MCGLEHEALKIIATDPDPPLWVIDVVQQRIKRMTAEIRANRPPLTICRLPIRFPTVYAVLHVESNLRYRAI